MSCRPATSKQKKYAKDLARRLDEAGYLEADNYSQRALSVNCVRVMSELIDEMKEKLDLYMEEEELS